MFQTNLMLPIRPSSNQRRNFGLGLRYGIQHSQVLHIVHQQEKLIFYQLNDNILKDVDNNPYLGLLISKDLKWASHIRENRTIEKFQFLFCYETKFPGWKKHNYVLYMFIRVIEPFECPDYNAKLYNQFWQIESTI